MAKSRELARAMLREIPLGRIDAYLQVLDSGLLRDRDGPREDNGDWCGGGCDAKGGACGAWCAFPSHIPEGCFDQFGHSGVTKEDLNTAIKDPVAFRQAFSEELIHITEGLRGTKPMLAPKINPKQWTERP